MGIRELGRWDVQYIHPYHQLADLSSLIPGATLPGTSISNGKMDEEADASTTRFEGEVHFIWRVAFWPFKGNDKFPSMINFHIPNSIFEK